MEKLLLQTGEHKERREKDCAAHKEKIADEDVSKYGIVDGKFIEEGIYGVGRYSLPML
jgi:UTP-glucose-1-phosphate uridylyltransferase